MFLLLVLVTPFYNICGDLALFAVAMEISTPTLCVHYIARTLLGHEMLSDMSGLLFAVLFFAFRVVFFTWGLYRSLAFWWVAAPTADDENVDENGTPHADLEGRWGAVLFLHIVYTSLFLVQLYWGQILARGIIRKLRRLGQSKPKDCLQLSQVEGEHLVQQRSCSLDSSPPVLERS